MDLTLTDLTGLLVETVGSSGPDLNVWPKHAPFRAWFWRRHDGAALMVMPEFERPRDQPRKNPHYVHLLGEQFPSLQFNDNAVIYVMDEADYVKMRMLFGGQMYSRGISRSSM